MAENWSNWARAIREEFPVILEEIAVGNDIPIEDYALQFRAPRGTAKSIVENTLNRQDSEKQSADIRITTFHQVKGETLDAVLVVSAPDRRSQGGHWKHWLDASRDNGEHMRFAYVASSRPRRLLIWAIPKVSSVDYTVFENLGFDLKEVLL